MGKTKQSYIDELVKIALQIDDKAARQEERTKKLQRMASLAKAGNKDSEEFKALEHEFQHPTVTDYGDEITALRRVVKQLKRYKL